MRNYEGTVRGTLDRGPVGQKEGEVGTRTGLGSVLGLQSMLGLTPGAGTLGV